MSSLTQLQADLYREETHLKKLFFILFPCLSVSDSVVSQNHKDIKNMNDLNNSDTSGAECFFAGVMVMNFVCSSSILLKHTCTHHIHFSWLLPPFTPSRWHWAMEMSGVRFTLTLKCWSPWATVKVSAMVTAGWYRRWEVSHESPLQIFHVALTSFSDFSLSLSCFIFRCHLDRSAWWRVWWKGQYL